MHEELKLHYDVSYFFFVIQICTITDLIRGYIHEDIYPHIYIYNPFFLPGHYRAKTNGLLELLYELSFFFFCAYSLSRLSCMHVFPFEEGLIYHPFCFLDFVGRIPYQRSSHFPFFLHFQ